MSIKRPIPRSAAGRASRIIGAISSSTMSLRARASRLRSAACGTSNARWRMPSICLAPGWWNAKGARFVRFQPARPRRRAIRSASRFRSKPFAAPACMAQANRHWCPRSRHPISAFSTMILTRRWFQAMFPSPPVCAAVSGWRKMPSIWAPSSAMPPLAPAALAARGTTCFRSARAATPR